MPTAFEGFKQSGNIIPVKDATAQATLEGILDGTDIDSFGDVETALAGKMPNYGIGIGLYVDSDTNQLRADAVTLAIKDSPKLITSGAVFSGLSPKYSTAEQEETDLDGQDKFPFYDNSASAKRHTTFGNIKAKLKEYFDSLYVAAVAGKGLSTNDYDNTAKAVVTTAQDNIIANTKLIKDTVGWSGKNKVDFAQFVRSVNTVTENNGVYTVVATSQTDNYPNVSWYKKSDGLVLYPAGKYRITINIVSFTNNTAKLSIRDVNNGIKASVPLSVGKVTLNVDTDYDFYISLLLRSGNTNEATVVFSEIMMCDADILDPTYEPHFGSTAFPRSEQAVLGAKNLLPLTLASLKASTSGGSWADNVYTNGGVAYTISTNSAGYVTEISASGTADGSDSYFRITTKLADYLTVGEKYTLNGCPSDGGISKYCIYTGSAGVWEDDGNGVDKEYVNTITNLFIKVNHDVTVNNLKFYPMIRLATDTDPTYVPYAMTNKELTDAVTKKTIQYSSKSDAIATLNKAYIKKVGSVCQCVIDFVVGSANINAWTNLVTFSENTGISPGSNQIIAIRDVTDTTKSSIVGAVINSGNLQIGSALTAEHRYMASFSYIAES